MTRAECARLLEREYDEKRRRAEADLARRVAAVEEAHPDIAELRRALRETLFAGGRARLEGRDAEKIWRSCHEQEKELGRLLAEYGYAKDELHLRPECALCEDTGHVGEGLVSPCACRKRREMELLYPNLHMDKAQTFEAFDESLFPDEGERSQRQRMRAYRNAAERYADTLPGGRPANIFLCGANGLGKTFLMNCICHRVAQRMRPVLSLTAYALSEIIRNVHRGEGTLQDVLGCDLLAIDDLGAEPLYNNVTIEYLFIILNERLLHKKNTIVVTNLAPLQIQERYTERVASRLFDKRHTAMWQFTGKDLRQGS